MIVVDRFESDIALLEIDGKMLEVCRSLLPKEAIEGSILTFDGEKYVLDETASTKRTQFLRDRFNSLRRKKKC